VVTADSACLLCLPGARLGAHSAKADGSVELHSRTRDLQRLLVGNASDVEIDGSGRILIPPPLRKFAGWRRT
jgi:MraZ protein